MLYMDNTSAPIKLILELSPDPGSVAGRLHLGDRDARAFSGYLEMVSLLEETRHNAREQTYPERPDQ